MLKLIYSNLEFQNCLGEDQRTPLPGGEGRGRGGRRGREREGKEGGEGYGREGKDGKGRMEGGEEWGR